MSDEKSLVERVQEEFPKARITRDDEVIEGQIVEIHPMSLETMDTIYTRMKTFVQSQMEEDLDFGVIPGTGGKPSLYKPGAEKLQRFFQYSVRTELAEATEEWHTPINPNEDSFPLFHYRYTTTVWDANDRLIATCDGECNSYESRYRWRWVPEHEIPSWYNKERLETKVRTESEFAFAIQNKETEGQYGKPMEYWESWEEDIKSGAAKQIRRKTRKGNELDAWERGGKQYRVPNTDIHSQVNTIMKIAQKRSYVGGVIIAANASEYFTQDLEDITPSAPEPEPVYVNVSIKDRVPNKTKMAKELVKYTQSLGVEDAGNWIKELLDTNNMAYSLDNWDEIIDLIDKYAVYDVE